MKSIITKLYNDESLKLENEEQRELRKQLRKEEARDKAHDELWNTLSDKQKDLFRKWELEYGCVWEEEVERYYAQGFKAGALLGLELGNADFSN
ncbi:MAG: hypothetical protein J6A46_03365 [Clostridia bacterium]|nr:hypothetical protein [Clostridia bacterium]